MIDAIADFIVRAACLVILVGAAGFCVALLAEQVEMYRRREGERG